MTKVTNDDAIKINQRAWNMLVAKANEWTVPCDSKQIEQARNGHCEIILTPSRVVPDSWLQPLAGADVLSLAGGGGQQSPLMAAAGARVTTLDNSQAQLDRDAQVGSRESLEIKTVLGKMHDLSMFVDGSFDLIVNPCSNCFTPDVLPVWQECFRVLRPGGRLITGFNNPVRYIFDVEEYEKGNLIAKNKIPYSDLESLSPEMVERFHTDGEPFEFGHSLDDQIGGQLAAGFQLNGFFEDNWGERFADDPLSAYLNSFISTNAIKPAAVGPDAVKPATS